MDVQKLRERLSGQREDDGNGKGKGKGKGKGWKDRFKRSSAGTM